MTNLQLNPGESRIGQGLVSYRDLEKHTYQCWHATIYVTNQRVFLDTYTGIELKLSKIRGFYHSNLVKILVGIRRCGKSVILRQIINEIKDSGVKEENVIYINFELIEYEELQDYKKLNEYIKKSIKDSKIYYICSILIYFLRECS